MFLFIYSGATTFPNNRQVQDSMERFKKANKTTVAEVVSTTKFELLIVANEKLIDAAKKDANKQK